MISHADTLWINKNILNADTLLYKISGNYQRYGNFTIIDQQTQLVYKIYNNKEIYEMSKLRWEWAHKFLSFKFIIPKIIGTIEIDQKFAFFYKFIVQDRIDIELYHVNHIFEIIDFFDELPISKTKIFDWYESKEIFDDIFKTDELILSHGDLHFANIIFNNGELVLIDWDNFSYQNREYMISVSCLYFLCNPKIRSNKKAVQEVIQMFTDKYGYDFHKNVLILCSKKIVLSKTDNTKKWLKQIENTVNEL